MRNLQSGTCFMRDSEGRAGRLWVHLVPAKLHDIFETAPKERPAETA